MAADGRLGVPRSMSMCTTAAGGMLGGSAPEGLLQGAQLVVLDDLLQAGLQEAEELAHLPLVRPPEGALLRQAPCASGPASTSGALVDPAAWPRPQQTVGWVSCCKVLAAERWHAFAGHFGGSGRKLLEAVVSTRRPAVGHGRCACDGQASAAHLEDLLVRGSPPAAQALGKHVHGGDGHLRARSFRGASGGLLTCRAAGAAAAGCAPTRHMHTRTACEASADPLCMHWSGGGAGCLLEWAAGPPAGHGSARACRQSWTLDPEDLYSGAEPGPRFTWSRSSVRSSTKARTADLQASVMSCRRVTSSSVPCTRVQMLSIQQSRHHRRRRFLPAL